MDRIDALNRVQKVDCHGKRFAFFADCGDDLESVVRFLGDAGRQQVDRVVFLGDFVGKTVDSHSILGLLDDSRILSVAGDKEIALLALTGNLPASGIEEFYTRNARQLLSFRQPELDYIASLPVKIETGLFYAAHASPLQPYFDDPLEQAGYDAFRIEKMRGKKMLDKPCFVAHSGRAHIHYPYKRIHMREGKEYVLEGCGVIYVPKLSDRKYLLYDSESDRLKVCRITDSLQQT